MAILTVVACFHAHASSTNKLIDGHLALQKLKAAGTSQHRFLGHRAGYSCSPVCRAPDIVSASPFTSFRWILEPVPVLTGARIHGSTGTFCLGLALWFGSIESWLCSDLALFLGRLVSAIALSLDHALKQADLVYFPRSHNSPELKVAAPRLHPSRAVLSSPRSYPGERDLIYLRPSGIHVITAFCLLLSGIWDGPSRHC